jgi:hypothetical protein
MTAKKAKVRKFGVDNNGKLKQPVGRPRNDKPVDFVCGTGNEIILMTPTEFGKMLKVCRENKVARLRYGGLEVEFLDESCKDRDISEHNPMSEGIASDKELATEDQPFPDDDLDHLRITNPVEAERRELAGG